MKNVLEIFAIASLSLFIVFSLVYIDSPDWAQNITPNNFKVRITDFSAGGYVVQYSYNGGISYTNYTSCWLSVKYGPPERYFPLIGNDLNALINQARVMTACSVREHNKEEDKIWDRHLKSNIIQIVFTPPPCN
jgi:hypothetical protein